MHVGFSVAQLPLASLRFFPSFWLVLLSLPAVPILSGILQAVDAPVTICSMRGAVTLTDEV